MKLRSNGVNPGLRPRDETCLWGGAASLVSNRQTFHYIMRRGHLILCNGLAVFLADGKILPEHGTGAWAGSELAVTGEVRGRFMGGIIVCRGRSFRTRGGRCRRGFEPGFCQV